MVEADSRIIARFIGVTELGIVRDGITLHFETLTIERDELHAKVRCVAVL